MQEIEEEVGVEEEAQVVNLEQVPLQPELPQPLSQVQPVPGIMTPEQMMALIQQLQAANTAKDVRIQELEQQSPVANPLVSQDIMSRER